MGDASFPKSAHLRRTADFERVYNRKCKGADGVLLMFVDKNDTGITRAGMSVSKKHGGAVVRNRLKRLLREAFRLERAQLPKGLDLVLVPLDKGKASLVAYRASIVGLVKRLSRKLDPQPKGDPPDVASSTTTSDGVATSQSERTIEQTILTPLENADDSKPRSDER